jgi:hypothetical protein
MPAPDTECFQIFLKTLAKKYRRQLILLFADGAGNHHSGELEVPNNIILHLLPPYSPELNPQENLWDEIREKTFKNYALKSMDDVYDKLEEAALYALVPLCAYDELAAVNAPNTNSVRDGGVA